MLDLKYSCSQAQKLAEAYNIYSGPMLWIGIYIAIASATCTLAMAVDLLHGFRNRKFWFPCKYFSLNAASITVISVAMKLPVDLSSPMPGFVRRPSNQARKHGLHVHNDGFHGQQDTSCKYHSYVLQIQDEMEFSETTVKDISNSMNRLIQKVKKEQHNDLLELLAKSTDFRGVEMFDDDQVQHLVSSERVNGWSLPVVTLTCIVVALPNIRKDKVESLLKGVGDGLWYTHLVEETLNSASEYANVRRATMNLWQEVEDNFKWLGNPLEENAFKGKTSQEILQWFADKSKEIVLEIKNSLNGEPVDNFPHKLIVANSMYRIAGTLLLNYKSNFERISKKQLFVSLSGMVSSILSACLTNIPRAVEAKCHESVIEKREASVMAAAKLLGRSTEIITKLEARERPSSMDQDKMAFIDEWRLHMKQSIP